MSESYQTFFNIAVTLIGFLGGWVLNSLKASIDALHKADTDLTTKVQAVEVLVAGQYVKRGDLNELSKAIFSKLDRIESKLDNKVDK